MNYLDLHNAVLDRLREERIVDTTVGTDPYYNNIGAHINDAKSTVEDAWQWNVLRQTDQLGINQGQRFVTLPESFDNNYVIQWIQVAEQGNYLRWITEERMSYWNTGNSTENTPFYYSTAEDDPITGNKQIQIFQHPNQAYTLNVYNWRNQAQLVAADDRLKVPSLPVYTLATALASRERGEVGGAPTSELFATASNHLADAIAYDSARHPTELEWTADGRYYNTNVRTA